MANFVFNVAKGKAAYYATLPGSSDALIAVPLQTSGLEPDLSMIDRTTLADILTVSIEQTTLGRKTLTGVASTVDHAADRAVVDLDDFLYTAGSGAPVGAFVICYDPDTTASVDANIIPLTKHDFSVIPSGSDIPVQISTSGVFIATSA